MTAMRALAAAAVAAYLLSGLYFVQPDEQAVVCRFGAVSGRPREPGAHWGLPWGLDRVERVKPREAKRMTIGLPEVTDGALGAGTAQFLTGDRNLVNVQATVHYTVRDAGRYLFGALSVDALLARAAEAVLAAELAVEPVDRALTEGKRDLAVRVAEGLRRIADAYELGILVRSVDLGAVEPPPEVADAFDAVVSALRQRDQAVNEAAGYSNRTRAEARGEAKRTVDRAEAHRDRVVHEARGEAQRFASLLAEYRRAPRLTAARMYLEAMEEILPRFRSKLVIDPRSGVDLSIVPGGDSGTAEPRRSDGPAERSPRPGG